MLRVVLKAGAREDLGAVDSSMSGFLWFDKQSVRRLAAKVAMSLHRPIVLSICRGERVKELKGLMRQGLKLMRQGLKGFALQCFGHHGYLLKKAEFYV